MKRLLAYAILWRCGADFRGAYLSHLDELFEGDMEDQHLLDLEIAADDVDGAWAAIEGDLNVAISSGGRQELKRELVRGLSTAYRNAGADLLAFVGVARSVWLLVGEKLDDDGDLNELWFADDFIEDEGGAITRAYYEDLFRRFSV